ncbi:hypothetical protein K443DRAFT_313554 [Laccaria amethystina LaAM-08-1]|uniref:Unplaced genomic scaffold K443scaffold_205, whole genome shotgun sequence n=1 Tax=Laccaria amethystina LaAM-08-1 TaxID=1095629 RepID=A0A0C9WUF9_9AGAR|nr:hypothetical protein K443DRAFT_313554 [Laccaria amethystina LaAM-08-1]
MAPQPAPCICWNYKVTKSSEISFPLSIFSEKFPYSHVLLYFIFLITRDTYLARVQIYCVPLVTP